MHFRVVICDIADVFYGENFDYFARNSLALNLLTAIIYLIVWIFIKTSVLGESNLFLAENKLTTS